MRLRESGTLRLLCFDLESRPSAYWYGDATTAQITAIGWKWADEKKPRTLLLQGDGGFVGDAGDQMPAGLAYALFRDVLCAAGIVYGHNIRRFDLPLFQAGLLREGLPPLPSVLTTDTLRDYPKRKDMSASLENLAKLHLGDGVKLHLSVADWELANRLEPDGIQTARRRVASDVLLQERLRARLLELGLLKPPSRWNP